MITGPEIVKHQFVKFDNLLHIWLLHPACAQVSGGLVYGLRLRSDGGSREVDNESNCGIFRRSQRNDPATLAHSQQPNAVTVHARISSKDLEACECVIGKDIKIRGKPVASRTPRSTLVG